MNNMMNGLVATAATVVAMGAFAHPAAAQGVGLPIKVKVGVFMPRDSEAKEAMGKTAFNGEVELALPSASMGHTAITLGYAEGSKNGLRLRVIPLTVSQVFSPPNPAGSVTGNVYFGAGVGAYFLHVSGKSKSAINLAEEAGKDKSTSKTVLGGFGVVGYSLPSGPFFEAKYHITGKANGVSASGLSLLIGHHF